MTVPLRRLRPYGFTFLTRPIGYTQDVEKAEASRFVYGPCDWPGAEGWYSTSALGILNGFLHRVGLSLQLFTGPAAENGGKYIVGWQLVIGRR